MKSGNRLARAVVVRTHGGLGNQIFQILYARLFAGGREPEVIHDDNYPHAFQLSEGFSDLKRAGRVARLASAMRVPKLLERSRLSDSGVATLFGRSFMDGYFQATRFYAGFAPSILRAEIERIRLELAVNPAQLNGGELFHLRLGDFFLTPDAERQHLSERLAQLPRGAFIITNREALVAETIDDLQNADRHLMIVPSGEGSAEDALRLMAGYQTINSNDSTLAFWAACLADRRLVTPSPVLRALFDLFSQAR